MPPISKSALEIKYLTDGIEMLDHSVTEHCGNNILEIYGVEQRDDLPERMRPAATVETGPLFQIDNHSRLRNEFGILVKATLKKEVVFATSVSYEQLFINRRIKRAQKEAAKHLKQLIESV